MGNCTTEVRYERLEELATMPTSQKRALLDLEDKDCGQLTIHVEGHQYLASRDCQGKVEVVRIDRETDRSKRFLQTITEFFTHQVADFFRLRGIGPRASRIKTIIENWVRLPDGQENIKGAPWIVKPSVTMQVGPCKRTVSQNDHVDGNLANHCPRLIEITTISKRSAPLTKQDYDWHRDNVRRLSLPGVPSSRPEGQYLQFANSQGMAAVRQAFEAAAGGAAFAESEFEALMTALRPIIDEPPPDAVNDLPRDSIPAEVFEARRLLLAHALCANKRTPKEALEVLRELQASRALHDLSDDRPEARQCWEAARLLARTGYGFRILCELIRPPAGLSDEVARQWRIALKIYLEVTDHVIGESMRQLQRARDDNGLTGRVNSLITRLEQFASIGESEAQGNDGFIGRIDRLVTWLNQLANGNGAETPLPDNVSDIRAEIRNVVLAHRQLTALKQVGLAAAACPRDAAAGAAAYLRDCNDPKENLLPYRVLCAAVKLLGIPERIDATWLNQHKPGASGSAPDHAVLEQNDVLALAVWRNGFRDDLQGGNLWAFAKLLNKMQVKWLPTDVPGPTPAETKAVFAERSPLRVALKDDMALGITRRTILEQAREFHLAVGRAARLVMLRLKMREGLPLSPHEELMFQALVLGDAGRRAIQKKGRGAESNDEIAELDRKLDDVLAMADKAGNLNTARSTGQPSVKARRTLDHYKGHELMLQAGTELYWIRQSLQSQYPDNTICSTDFQTTSPYSIERQPEQLPDKNRDAARATLLHYWLNSTEAGNRWRQYRVTEDVCNAVISELADILHFGLDRNAIERELNKTTYIDLQLLKQWTADAGLPRPVGKMKADAGSSEMDRRCLRDWRIIAALQSGRDKVDADMQFTRPKTRAEFGEHFAHFANLNLGCSAWGEVSYTSGESLTVNVNAGAALPLGSPSICFSASESETKTVRFAAISSSVAGSALQGSKEKLIRSTKEAGVKGTMQWVGVKADGGTGTSNALEHGFALRFPPQQGSRSWVGAQQETTRTLFSDEMAEAAMAARTAAKTRLSDTVDVRGRHFDALEVLCWRHFDRLLTGEFALNTFTAEKRVDTLTAGVSGSVGIDAAPDIAELSGCLRIGGEYDLVLRQTRVDHAGSTRLEIHSIGEGSRQTAAMRAVLALFPQSRANLLPIATVKGLHDDVQAHSSISGGTLLGLSATFRERGRQHIIRREMRDGITQATLSWDIVYRDVDSFIAHMNRHEVCKHWREYSKLVGDTAPDLDTVLKTFQAHTRHSNQSYLVRYQLIPEKLIELNALTAILQGLDGEKAPLGEIANIYAIFQRCQALLEDKDQNSYELCGVGLYANDRKGWEGGLNGVVIDTVSEVAGLGTEQLWFGARITAEMRNGRQPRSTDQQPSSQTASAGQPQIPLAIEEPATVVSSLVHV